MFWFPKRGPRGIGPLDMTNIGKTKHSSERGLEYIGFLASIEFLFSRLFHSQKILSGPLKSFYRPKWQISLPFHTLRLAKFLHQKTERRTPFGGGASPVQGILPPAPRKRLTWSLLMMPLLTINLGGFPCSKSEDLNKSLPLPFVWSVFNMIRVKYLTNSYAAPFGVKCNWADAQKNRIC